MVKRAIFKGVLLGKSPRIESNVTLGVIPERLKNPSQLVIGNFALLRSGSVLYRGTKIGKEFKIFR